MAKKKAAPITQHVADVLSQIDATAEAVKSWEEHRILLLSQLERKRDDLRKLERELQELNNEIADTDSLIHAQKEKLFRDTARLHTETETVRDKLGCYNNALRGKSETAGTLGRPY